MCCLLCLGVVSQVLQPPAGLQHSSIRTSDLQDMRNMHPESTVTRPLLCAAPRQAAGLAVGLQDT